MLRWDYLIVILYMTMGPVIGSLMWVCFALIMALSIAIVTAIISLRLIQPKYVYFDNKKIKADSTKGEVKDIGWYGNQDCRLAVQFDMDGSKKSGGSLKILLRDSNGKVVGNGVTTLRDLLQETDSSTIIFKFVDANAMSFALHDGDKELVETLMKLNNKIKNGDETWKDEVKDVLRDIYKLGKENSCKTHFHDAFFMQYLEGELGKGNWDKIDDIEVSQEIMESIISKVMDHVKYEMNSVIVDAVKQSVPELVAHCELDKDARSLKTIGAKYRPKGVEKLSFGISPHKEHVEDVESFWHDFTTVGQISASTQCTEKMDKKAYNRLVEVTESLCTGKAALENVDPDNVDVTKSDEISLS